MWWPQCGRDYVQNTAAGTVPVRFVRRRDRCDRNDARDPTASGRHDGDEETERNKRKAQPAGGITTFYAPPRPVEVVKPACDSGNKTGRAGGPWGFPTAQDVEAAWRRTGTDELKLTERDTEEDGVANVGRQDGGVVCPSGPVWCPLASDKARYDGREETEEAEPCIPASPADMAVEMSVDAVSA
jgi:hypothetical protein